MKQLENHTAQLAAITNQIKSLEEEARALKEKMLEEMKADKITSYQSPFGVVSFVTRKSYTYTDAVKQLEEEVKLKKVEEEERGLATVKVTEFISLKVSK